MDAIKEEKKRKKEERTFKVESKTNRSQTE